METYYTNIVLYMALYHWAYRYLKLNRIYPVLGILTIVILLQGKVAFI
jgi:hypothetical protein